MDRHGDCDGGDRLLRYGARRARRAHHHGAAEDLRAAVHALVGVVVRDRERARALLDELGERAVFLDRRVDEDVVRLVGDQHRLPHVDPPDVAFPSHLAGAEDAEVLHPRALVCLFKIAAVREGDRLHGGRICRIVAVGGLAEAGIGAVDEEIHGREAHGCPVEVHDAARDVDRSGRAAGRVADPEGLVGVQGERERVAVQLQRGRRVVGGDEALAVAGDLRVRRQLQAVHLRGVVGHVAARVAQRAVAVGARSGDLVADGVPAPAAVHVKRRAVLHLHRHAVVPEDRRRAILHEALRHRGAGQARQRARQDERAGAVLDEVRRGAERGGEVQDAGRVLRDGDAERAGIARHRDVPRGEVGAVRHVQGVSVEVHRAALGDAVLQGGPLGVGGKRHVLRQARAGGRAGRRADEPRRDRDDPRLMRSRRALREVGSRHVLVHHAARAVEERALPRGSLHRHEVAHHDAAVLHQHRVEAELRVVRGPSVIGEHAEVDERIGREVFRDGGRGAAAFKRGLASS